MGILREFDGRGRYFAACHANEVMMTLCMLWMALVTFVLDLEMDHSHSLRMLRVTGVGAWAGAVPLAGAAFGAVGIYASLRRVFYGRPLPWTERSCRCLSAAAFGAIALWAVCILITIWPTSDFVLFIFVWLCGMAVRAGVPRRSVALIGRRLPRRHFMAGHYGGDRRHRSDSRRMGRIFQRSVVGSQSTRGQT